MTNIYKCLEDFNSIRKADADFPMEFFETYLELHQNMVELQHLIANDPDNIVEIKTLLNCLINSDNSFNDHIKDIQEFLQFYNYRKEIDSLLNP